ncbi:diaminopimelate decarboxylase [Thermosulfuriphilus ammonigenes]|uniref:Diaminopimelate decarboxylase n=1 Tax=Thermosulfuriphilus ammonigenes TaxID=1936021 RepID=A0A6G7PW44_9BACT|nr:diaminopimelate decarboxylase [Thermosulfuriphilus ammonigenes]MBA2848157.1 diaminopimelate decarboxylase [Thermosulfuriphilus ammonigenes]QIJ71668.1 diaminopimelate decarboxylase [Thermosulfuriphilus ammonigenes]HFB83500.1 diaminopimelate decarboxylase [Thermodesulfatator sp.]
MHHFWYPRKELYCENVPVGEIIEKFGTPCYIYSLATLERHYQAFDQAFSSVGHLVCYSVKANSNLAILAALARLGAGADIVSGGELYRAIKAGIPASRIVFSGVGKTEAEIEAALKSDILMFNVESLQELELIGQMASRMGKEARVALRINPDVDPQTHPYISTGLRKNKFGLPLDQALEGYRLAREMPGLSPVGVDCHIGSQITELSPFLDALKRVKEFISQLEEEGIKIRYLDLGGGLGIPYRDETPPHPTYYGQALVKELKGLPYTLILEPGRVIVGNAGILVTRVLYTKDTGEKRFVIVDAGMNDLARPSLYGSYHEIVPVRREERETVVVDVVGPICESGDFLARERPLPEVAPGDLLAVMSAGAYGFVMASNYNSRPRPAEVLVKGDQFYLVRERESYDDLIRGEIIPWEDGHA